MLNKTIRSTIIVTIQFIVPAALLLIFAPQLLNHTHQLNQARAFFNTHQLQFLLAHISFYLALFWIWPLLIKLISTRLNSKPDTTQINTAIKARWYLIAAMAFLELLAGWK
jgi:hypothetical protein